MSLVKELYEPYVLSARARISTDPLMRRLVDPAISPEVLERFFIQLHALGLYLAEPHAGWLRRTGQRCLLHGQESLGRALLTRARHEAGQHQQMAEDVRLLVQRWNARHQPPLHAERLGAQHPTDVMRAFRQLHESTITGELPAARLALELELHNLTFVLLPHLLSNVARVLGREALDGLGLVRELMQWDPHTPAPAARLLEEVLQTMPENARTFAELGAEGLELSLRFLGDCLYSAEASLGLSEDEESSAVA